MAGKLNRVMFFIILVSAVGGTIAFGVMGYIDTNKIVDRMSQSQDWQTAKVLEKLPSSATSSLGQIYAALELDTLTARNDRANAQLGTRTWLRFLTSLFGAILIVFGAAFVLGRVTGDEVQASGGVGAGLSASLKTTSPGIILAALGVFLMSLPLWALQEIQTRDGASFGVFILTEGPDGPIVTLSPVTGGVPLGGGPAVPIPSEDEIAERLKRIGVR